MSWSDHNYYFGTMSSRTSSSTNFKPLRSVKSGENAVHSKKKNPSMDDNMGKENTGACNRTEHCERDLTSKATNSVYKSASHHPIYSDGCFDARSHQGVVVPPNHSAESSKNKRKGSSSVLVKEGSIDTRVAGIDHAYISQRSKELVRRAHDVIGRASQTLSSSKKESGKLYSHDPLCQGRRLFSGTQDRPPISFSWPDTESRKLDPPSVEPEEFLMKDPPGSVSENSTTSTTYIVSSSEEDLPEMYAPSPYNNPYAHYPDPGVHLSIMSTDDSLVLSSSSGRRSQGRSDSRKTTSSNIDIVPEQECYQGGRRRTTRHSVPRNASKQVDSWIDCDGNVFRNDEGLDMFVGPSHHCSQEYYRHEKPNSVGWTTSPSQANNGGSWPAKRNAMRKTRHLREAAQSGQFGVSRLPVSHIYQHKESQFLIVPSDDSLTCSAAFPSLSNTSPKDPGDGASKSSSKDGLFYGRGHDSISTLSDGTAVKNKFFPPKGAVMPCLTSSHGRPRVGFQTPIASEARAPKRHPVPVGHPNKNKQVPLPVAVKTPTTNPRSMWPSSSALNARLGGPGGKYLVDEPLPIPTCCEVFFGSFRSTKPEDEYRFQCTQATRTPAASMSKLQNFTPTTAGSPDTVIDFPRSHPAGGRVVQERISF